MLESACDTVSLVFPLSLSRALFNGAATPQRQDAVGFAASSAALREGAGLPNAPDANGQYAFVRDYAGALPKDTPADSSQDFLFVATSRAAVTGSGGDLPPQYGAPSPAGLESPSYFSRGVTLLPIDPKVSATAEPNRVRVGGLNSGTLLLRRTLTNSSNRTLAFAFPRGAHQWRGQPAGRHQHPRNAGCHHAGECSR